MSLWRSREKSRGFSPSSMTSAYSVRSEMRIAPRTDISASRSCGGADRPARSDGRAARAVSGGGGMAGERSYQRLRPPCTRSCRYLRRSMSAPTQTARGGWLLLIDDDRLDGRRDVVGDLHDDHVRADVLDRLVEVDLPAVELQAAGVADRIGDVLGGDRPEQAAVLAGLLVDGQHGARERRRALLRLLDGLGRGALGARHAVLRGLDRALRRRLGQLARDQEVAQVALRDIDDRAALTDALDVLEQDGLGHR